MYFKWENDKRIVEKKKKKEKAKIEKVGMEITWIN